MNIKHYLSAMAALAMLAACSDYDPGMSEDVKDYTDVELKVLNEYAENFANHFGGIDPNHTWGFGEIGSEDEMGTRAVQVDRPNWTIYVYEDGQVKLKSTVGTKTGPYTYSYTEKAGYIVPGFPSAVDGLYYYDQDGNGKPAVYTQEDIHSFEEQNPKNLPDSGPSQSASIQPYGDVTDEEVQYVSWWFRNNYKPESVLPPFTEFFMQDISKDFDRVIAYDGNGKPVSCHGDRINNGKIPLTYADGTIVTDNNGNIQYDNTSFQMDHMIVYTSEANPEHLNDYNAGSTPDITGEGSDLTNRYDKNGPKANPQLKYWETNGGYTTKFSYQCSSDIESRVYDQYVLVHLTFDIPQENGPAHHYDGYYLAFDYEMHKNDGVYNNKETFSVIEPDGFYSNWIVKLSPGNPQWSDHNWYRIMCEDLGNTYDYDFNDLVYDVYYTGVEPNYTAHIKVQAAGGTYPIFIGANDEAHEVHHMLGHGDKYNAATKLYQPINVGTDLKSASYEFTLPVSTTNPDDIKIFVENPNFQDAREKNDFTLPRVGEELTDAPQKICIPGNTTKWTLENRNIELAYPNFVKWVNKEEGGYGFGQTNDWTRTDVDETKLYK